jgi:MraZ protein
MFIGEYRHTFDAKNRISLPARFRRELGKSVIVTRGLDGCLSVYTKAAWKQEVASMENRAIGNAASRGLARFMLSGAVEAEVDAAGRILIPDYLKEYAGLKVKSVITGMSSRVELWDEGAWAAYHKTMERDVAGFAENAN